MQQGQFLLININSNLSWSLNGQYQLFYWNIFLTTPVVLLELRRFLLYPNFRANHWNDPSEIWHTSSSTYFRGCIKFWNWFPNWNSRYSQNFKWLQKNFPTFLQSQFLIASYLRNAKEKPQSLLISFYFSLAFYFCYYQPWKTFIRIKFSEISNYSPRKYYKINILRNIPKDFFFWIFWSVLA
jgi:hypothetical protein